MMTNVEDMKAYFLSGATHSVSFRKEQLKKLKQCIYKYENEINISIYNDLKKSAEEVWITETGIVISEINYFLKHIDELAAPQKVRTNLANQPGKSFIIKEPLGVVLIIAPWNYPLQLSLAPLVGAIAAGNCAVVKPSEFAPHTEAIVQKIIAETFAPEYISCTTGDGAKVIPALMQNFRFDHVFYIGSTHVGKIIYKAAAEQLTPVTLELGGKNPCIVTDKANLKLAAKRIVLGKFVNAGQTCIAPDYVLVHQSVRDVFIDLLKQTITDFYGENPADSYDYGRIINKKQFMRLVNYIKSGDLIFGGSHNEDMLYISPTIIGAPDADAAILREEIFGPLLPVIAYRDNDIAFSFISDNDNPLALYVFTNDKKEAAYWLEKVPSGGACINSVAMHYFNKSLPFGGRGNSGMGHYHGKFSMDIFSHQKGVLKAATWMDLPIAYPSFKGKMRLLKKLFR